MFSNDFKVGNYFSFPFFFNYILAVELIINSDINLDFMLGSNKLLS